MAERVVLAYSGGLDTSVGIGWLKDATEKEVVALAIDVGQGGEDMNEIRQRALDCGAIESVVVDAREEFANDYVVPALKANALYQKRYPLVSALSRPLIAKHLVAAARSLGASAIAHGCTGRERPGSIRDGHCDPRSGTLEHCARARPCFDARQGDCVRRLTQSSSTSDKEKPFFG